MMNGNVVSLARPQPGEPDQELIEGIQGLLDQAKSGQLQGIAFAAMYSDGTYYVDWDGRSTALPMSGAINMLSFNFAAALNTVAIEPETA